MRTQRVKPIMAAVAMAMGLGAGAAHGQVTWFQPITVFEDANLDFFIDVNGNGLIDQGDRLVSPLEVFQTAPVPNPGGALSVPIGGGVELTGLLDVTITGSTCGAVPTASCNFTLGPTPGGTFGNTGALVGFWLTTPNLDLVGPNCTSLADCTARATDGALFFTAGFNGDVNERFVANNLPNDPTALANVNATTTVGIVSYGLNVLANNTGQTFGLQACDVISCNPGGDFRVQLTGSGNIQGAQGLPPSLGAFARSDFDYQLAPLPEPGSLLLLSTVLGAIGFASRRKKVG